MDTAKIFMNGKSQAVRLPKQFRFKGKEVYIKKMGNTIILLPKDSPWQSMIDSLDMFTDDIFKEGRNQPKQQQRRSFLHFK